jgi:methylmalonyl-CoA/ethylmalonyl-CoA epimerase
MTLTYLGVDHIGIAVEDLSLARDLYENTLGFRVSGEEHMPQRGIDVCFVETGNARIELLAPSTPDSEISKFLAKRGEGIHHLCVRVLDIDGAVAALTTRGARLIGCGVQTGAHDTRVAFIHPKSTRGVLLELVEASPRTEATT